MLIRIRAKKGDRQGAPLSTTTNKASFTIPVFPTFRMKHMAFHRTKGYERQTLFPSELAAKAGTYDRSTTN